MTLTKSQISISLTKGELSQVINEALQDSVASAAIKRALNPFLVDSFPQFPEHTHVTLAETDETGVTSVLLKQPVVKKPAANIGDSVGDAGTIVTGSIDVSEIESDADDFDTTVA